MNRTLFVENYKDLRTIIKFVRNLEENSYISVFKWEEIHVLGIYSKRLYEITGVSFNDFNFKSLIHFFVYDLYENMSLFEMKRFKVEIDKLFGSKWSNDFELYYNEFISGDLDPEYLS